jgi:ABC-type multidrug transport system ATPase subunit
MAGEPDPSMGFDYAVATGLATSAAATRSRVRTVHITTPALEIADRPDCIAILAHARLIVPGTLDELRPRTGKIASSLENTFINTAGRGMQQKVALAGALLQLVISALIVAHRLQ